MTAPLVSVIVPTYNRAYCLPDAIESALNQTHANVEIMIVDDGSTDETEALVASRWGREPRVRYIKQVNKGVAAARNTGLARCSGDFVALLDSDDKWKPWKLELQLACLAECPEAGMVWTDMQAVDPRGNQLHAVYLRLLYSAWEHFTVKSLFGWSKPLEQIAPTLSDNVAGRTLYCGDVFSEMVRGNLVHTPTVLLRRERALKVGGFDETLCPAGEDYDFHLRTCREGPVAFIDMPTIEYRVGMADALSRQAYSLSTNFLKIVERTLGEDRAKIRLSAAQIDWVLADANAWVGQVLLDQGDGSGARHHLLTSLRHQSRQPKVVKLLALALLPRGVRESVRASYGAVKRTVTDQRNDRHG